MPGPADREERAQREGGGPKGTGVGQGGGRGPGPGPSTAGAPGLRRPCFPRPAAPLAQRPSRGCPGGRARRRAS